MFGQRRLLAGLDASGIAERGQRERTTGRIATGHLRGMAGAGLAAFALLALTALATAGPAAAQAPAPQILVFHDGSDATTDAGVATIETLGTENGFGVAVSDDPADINTANLEQYAAVVFLDADGDVLPDPSQENALRSYVQDGHGFLGIGSTAEAEQESNFFDGLIGARPAGSEGGVQTVVFGDRVHPATADLPLMLDRTDQWYQWTERPTGQVHTVARWHAPDDPAGDGTDVGGTDHPVSWCRDFQGGRSFYTGMGRTAGSYEEAEIQDHLLGAIQWTAGLVRANCKATIASNYSGERLVNGTSGDLTHTGESHGLTIAPNGWVIYIGRGDCRTNEQRGEIAGLPGPTPRILDFSNPNVGVGCGNVHIFDPAEYDGTVNSGVDLAGIIPVYGDRGSGNEINGKIEAGLLGITLAPDFMETGHIYVQYFPTFNPDNPNHPGLADGADRRRTKMHHPRISRFTIDLETKTLDLDSEVVIFEYESQIYSCCHQGGGMGFDSEGNLYFTTGDSNSSQGSNGYSGNNPTAKCPQRNPLPGPGDPANNNDCGELNFSYQDARRTAGSTNDYNGKMIRFNPIDDIPDGEQPEIGIGTTYTLPTAESPNGPNLFDGTEGDGNQTKPEIYAMGLRNPSRLAIDPETDIPYAAWVGPDAGGPNVDQGPSTYENASQIPQAGNYGWPYCMGNQQAYRDRLSGGALRTTNEPGFVSGGPAGSPIQGFYDCDNLVNDSENNTGLEVLPHETGTGMDAGTARPLNVWYSRGNPGGANGCPDFERPNGAPNYGANPTALCPYLIASGATVFTGPVYRYNEETADPSVAFPEYWDGRWFLQDFGNNSAKHGLLLDPETDQDGSQPIYADSLRGVLNWNGNYMDSKFAPDGSYYVQVYDGFFTTGNNAGLWRFTYDGGPPTPGADPQWEATGTPLEVQFDIGASGGVSYEWDFGDGSEPSTEASPVHAYAADGPYDVTLTVTYADGATDSKTITVNPSGDDTAAPVTTIQLNGSDPVPTYTGPVEVSLAATDDGGVGVELTQFRVDGGAFTEYTGPFTVSEEGQHTVEYRSRDGAGNVEDTKSVEFTIQGPGGGEDCLPQSDEFDGDALDAKWDVLREVAADPPVVAGGGVSIPLRQGDFIANDPLAENVLLQDAPSGEWTVTAALDIADINANGEQAGLVMWKSENPNTFSKIVFIQANSGQRQFEHIVTQDGGVDPPIPQSITPAPADLPANGTVLLRARYDGDSVTAEFSDDDGATWTLIGQEGHEAPLAAPLRVGLTAFRGGTGEGNATFDWFRVHEGSEAGGPVDCGGGTCVTRSDEFDAADLDTDRWTTVRNEPGRAPSVSDGSLVLPVAHTDIDGGNTGPITYVAQDAPDGAFEVTTRVAIEHTSQWQHGGLMMWVDDDNYTKLAFTRNPEGGRFIEYWTETDGARETHVDNINDPGTWPNHMFFRLASDGESELTASYSTDGETWTQLEGTAPLWTDEGTQIGVNAMADEGSEDIDASFDFVRFTPDGDCPTGDSCDEFDGTEIDPKWEIVNPSATNPPTVSDGHLNMPMIQGDLFGGNGTAQMLLQGVPTDESWVLTAKIAHEAIDTDGEAAGLALVNRFDPNHFAKTALQYKDDTGGGVPGVWAERVLTADSQAITLPGETVPFPNSGLLEFDGDYGWVRFVHDADAQEIGTWTSTDGEEFVNFGENMPVDEYLSEPGGLRAGVFAKHDGSGDDVVRLDAFNVVVGSADPQTPPDECQSGGGDNTAPTTTATTDPAEPDGQNGWFLGDVEVTLDATDNPGGSGVESTEYAIDGGEFQPYDAPFTVSGDGEHTVEYRSTDAEGNVEATKSLDLRIDSTPPTTEATVEGNEVTLEADDGDGSGVARTEFRIDGGEWQEYVEEQTILGSEADLADWAQAGPGGLEWMDEEGGFARTFGGLGMPWYPVREFGDFSLKLEWRDSSTGTSGNSGVFVRFPDPRIPLADRPTTGPGDWDGQYCGRTGAAAGDPAWVAIYCGQEIQINDYQTDTQKTGSIYNFDVIEADDYEPGPRGEWNEYEVRVEGQQYTVTYNGVVINEFDNSQSLESIRAGDPPTDARQFDSGYIGLQNHGGSDVIDFRNVTILPLGEGTVQGPIVLEPGQSLEFRSTDAAGNVEDIKSLEPGEAELRTRVAPRRTTVKAGKPAKFQLTVRNAGDVAAREVEMCVKAPKRKVKVVGADCRETPTLGKGRSVTAPFRLKAKRSAQGDRVRVRFVTTADNAGRATETATLKVKKKGKRGR